MTFDRRLPIHGGRPRCRPNCAPARRAAHPAPGPGWLHLRRTSTPCSSRSWISAWSGRRQEGLPPDTITTRQLAEKVIELYWPHCAPYDDRALVLRQNCEQVRGRLREARHPGRIVRHIQEFRGGADANPAASLPLPRARVRRRQTMRSSLGWSSGSSSRCPCRASSSSAGRRIASSMSMTFTKVSEERGSPLSARGEVAFDNLACFKPGVGAALGRAQRRVASADLSQLGPDGGQRERPARIAARRFPLRLRPHLARAR